MKSTAVLFSCLIAFVAMPVWADPGSVQVGLKGGMNFATLDRDVDDGPSETIDNRTGFGGGAELSITASPAFSFEIDFLYLQKGAKIQTKYRNGNQIDEPATVFDSDYQLDYATVAPMLRFTSRRSGLSPYVQLGGEVGYLVSANEHAESYREGESVTFKSDNDVKEQFAETDFALALGLGFE
ncbi:MAG: outer membrane beta-barrel protein, partial [Candidatus Latescibacteria bacterium]|nr:outer membrane beta-barrel protein [Candidatus Latescibacterota bacterium]